MGLFVGAHLKLDDRHEIHFVGRSVLRRAEASVVFVSRISNVRRLRFDVKIEFSLRYKVLRDMDVIIVC